jgi:uncharacterized protein YbjT (DUF2867 family)
VGDLTTGQGLGDACEGADVVVHAASDTHRMGRADERQAANLLASAGGAGHLVYLSIVGVDRIPYGYYRRKLACERLVAEGPVPSTVLRATQFHQLLAGAMRLLDRLPVAPLPLAFRFQPIAAGEVAARLAGLAGADPAGRVDDLGGPEVLTLGELARVWRSARGRPVRVVDVPVPGEVARGFRQGRNTCPDHAAGEETWERFAASYPVAGT